MELRKKTTKFKTPKEFWQKIILFAYLSIGFPLLAFFFLYFEWEADHLTPYFSGDYVTIIAGLFMTASIYFAAEALRRASTLKKEARKQASIQKKLNIYLDGATQKYKYLFFSSVTVTASFYLTSLIIFPMAFAVLIIIYSIGAPTLPNLAHDLGLKEKQRKDFIHNKPFYIEHKE